MAQPRRPLQTLLWLTFALAASGCGLIGGGPTAVLVEPIEIDGRVWQVSPVGDNLLLTIQTGTEPATGAYLEFDTKTATVVESHPFPYLSGGPFHIADGVLWSQKLHPLDGVPFITTDPDFGPDTATIVKFDLETGATVGQIPLDSPAVPRTLVRNNKAWLGQLFVAEIDLATGDRDIVASGSNITQQLVVFDGSVWWNSPTEIRKLDPVTGDRIAELTFEEEVIHPPHGTIMSWDDRYWVAGETQGDPGMAYEFNLDTLDVSNPISAELIPTRHFEAADHRWELYNEYWNDDRPVVFSEDNLWQITELETGDLIGEYDFGDYAPVAVQNGSLWLQSEDAFGRVPLEQLIPEN